MERGGGMKVSNVKAKVAAKVAKGKAKVAKKCGRAGKRTVAAGCVIALLALVGCTSPAQRAQTAETRQIFNIHEGSTATFTFGSEFVSLAQSNETGGNDAGQVATRTTEVKPEVAVGVGGSSAGVGSSGASKQGVGAAIGGAVDALAGAFSPTDAEKTDTTETQLVQKCDGGDCSDCTDESCDSCTDCAPK